jgi:transcriptional regulator with XRE-family HTH domain
MGNRLKEIRFFGSIKQCELALRAGVPQATLSRIEIGWIQPNEQHKKRLAEALKLPVGDIFPEKENGQNRAQKDHKRTRTT